MFQDLHALAQSATLLVIVAAEGDDLRVSVTPHPADPKKPHALRPLSLLGTPAELDADFAAALIAWQAPRKSLVEQAQDTAVLGDISPAAGTKVPAIDKKPPAPAPTKGKPGPKKKDPEKLKAADVATETEQTPTAAKADEVEGFELTASVAEEIAVAPAVEIEEPAAPAPVVDTKTLDLF